MTRSTLAEKPEKTIPETGDTSGGAEPVYYQSSTGTFRQFLMATGAILLSITINLALLAFIGYVDNAESPTAPTSSQPSVNTIKLQQVQEVTASTPSRSTDPSRTDASSSKTSTQPAPDPQPVSQVEPLEIDHISSNFNVEPPRFRLGGGATDLNADQLKQTTETASASSGNKQGNAFRSGELDQLPGNRSGPELVYPLEAKQNKTEGWVLLKLDVARDGTITNVRVIDWEGSPAFKEEAVEKYRQSTFEQPGRRNGSPVDAKNLEKRIRFTLEQ